MMFISRLFGLSRLFGRLRAQPTVWIMAAELKDRLDRDTPDMVPDIVIDVRGDDEFMGDLGHISSARNIPVQELATRIGELAAAKGDPITMVCKTDMRSAKAADILRGQGFTHVSALKGGMEAWTQHGFSVDR